jgi:hypothetical protein
MTQHGSACRTHSFKDVAEASESDQDKGRAGFMGRSEDEMAMGAAKPM